MLKPLFFLTLFIPTICLSQFTDNFEDADISGWTESISGHWAASDISPISGTYSLHHIFDNPDAGIDQVSVELPVLDLNDTITWEFRIRHGYNPSSSNNWSIFLMSDANAIGMNPSGSANGYAVGVNYTGSTDTLKFWKITSGSANEVFKTSVNWQIDVGTTKSPAIQVVRTPAGFWKINFNVDGDFDSLTEVGSGSDVSFTLTNYFGAYFEYSASQDQQLWIDDINIIGEIFVDSISPQLDSLGIISSNEIYLEFDEHIDSVSAVNILNYSIEGGLGNPDSVYYNDTRNAVRIVFFNHLSNKQYYHISIRNIKDITGNSMKDTTVQFLYFVPEPFDIVINEIMADPTPEINLPGYEYIEILNTTEFDIDLTGWKLKIGSSERVFSDQVLDSVAYVTLCSATAAEFLDDYGMVIGFSSFPTITNSGTSILILDEKSEVIDSVDFTTDWYHNNEKDNGGWSIERIDPLNTCSEITNWKASEGPNGGTPGQENSVYDTNIDMQAPIIIKAEIVTDNELRLYFNEPLETTSAVMALNYSVSNGIGNPAIVTLSSDKMEVNLFFANLFTDEHDYVLTMENLSDYCGNLISGSNFEFVYYVVKPFDIVINEIFADPDPVIGLPEYEFIEIYNTSGFDLNLNGWKLKVGTTIRNFPDYILDSATYVTLCPVSANSFYNTYGNVLGFTSFPTVSNAGTSITIMNKDSVVIDSVNFTTDWYHNQDKEDGGWSLEKIDPLNNCSGITNWKASENSDGGTPGQENSIFTSNIDTEVPSILSVEVISENELRLVFSEPLDKISALNNSNYLVDNGIGNPDTVILNNDLIEVNLTFSNVFADEQNYILTTEFVEDFCDNAMSAVNNGFIYYVSKPFDIVVNEIFADPDPIVGLPEFEFIEIYNISEFDLDLSGWKLQVGSSIKSFPDSMVQSNSFVILCSSSAGEYYNDYGKLVVISSFPSIPNTGGAVILYNENNTIIDSVNYNINWYNNSEKDDGGWSLEKIDPLNNCSGITNWKASENSDGGTPGSENSVFTSNLDNEAPYVEKVEIISGNQLKIYFNEPLTIQSINGKMNYKIDNGVGNPFSIMASEDLRKADLLFLNSFPEKTDLRLTSENLTDNCGNCSNQSNYLLLYYVVQHYDIVFNEIMADPEPSVSLPEYEYLEIYNRSDFSINLKGWTLQIGSTVKILSEKYIGSNDYLIITSVEADSVLSEFGEVLNIPGFLGLANSGQILVLRDPTGQIISQVSYSADWYQDDYKAEGGWSLEQIDHANPCGGENNWIASESQLGGTPGYENSVYTNNPDLEAPELLRVSVIDNKNIQLYFNESIDRISAIRPDNYTVDNGIGNPVSIRFTDIDYRSLILGFTTDFETNRTYELIISGGIFDCSGNEIYDKNTARFSVPLIPEENDLVINEILFNPLPNGNDFIEVYNRSEKTLDLQDLLIASYDDETVEYSGIEKISPEGYLIFPGEYMVLTENPATVQQDYFTPNPNGFIKVNSLPAFNDDKGRIMLLDKQQNIIDNFAYSEDFHFALLATYEGVSLERINYENPANDKTNWHSASELVGFATPGYENSQYKELAETIKEVSVEPEVFSPDNDGYEDFTNISFFLEEPGYIANIKIYDSKGRLVKYLVNNLLLSVESVITWDGIDDNNQKAPVGIYVIFVEIFDLDGNVKRFKKSVVVAAKY